jgi:C4-type Zn-finger protein
MTRPKHYIFASTPRCPECGSAQTSVISKTPMIDDQILRRRSCVDCGHRWYTVQPPEDIVPPNYRITWSHFVEGTAYRHAAVVRDL